MDQKSRRIWQALAVLLAWLAINVVVGRLTIVQSQMLPGVLTEGIQPVFVAAILLLFGAIWLLGWDDLGFNAPFAARSLVVFWPPLLVLAVLLGAGLTIAPRGGHGLVFALANALLVGLSEELMFRGILFQGLRSRLGIWPSIWLTALVFGAIHLFNGLWLGSFALAAVQACAAVCTGMLLMTFRLRTRSLDPAIIFHGAWDFSLVLISTSPQMASAPRPEISASVVATVSVFAAVTLSYSIFLLRNVARTETV
jgi:membrane protease YdiL (CAAX protease family)